MGQEVSYNDNESRNSNIDISNYGDTNFTTTQIKAVIKINRGEADLSPIEFQPSPDRNSETIENHLVNTQNDLQNLQISSNENNSDAPDVVIEIKRKDLFVVIRADKKVGRPIGVRINKYYKMHSKFSSDNIIRKINVSYLKFIISFLNSLINHLGLGSNREYQFKKFYYEYIKVINKERMTENKSKTIGQLINDIPISSKYKGYKKNKEKKETKNEEKNHNQKLIEFYSKKLEIMRDILEGEFLSLFPIYYKSERKVDLSKFGKNDYLILPKKVELFQDLFRKGRNSEDVYISKLKNAAKTHFLSE